MIGPRDLVLAGVASVAVVVASALVGRRWLAIGFDPGSARALGIRSPLPDAVLLVLIAVAVVVALPAIGALLATALFVVPAATVRLLTAACCRWQLGSVALAAAEGVAGLWLSVELNVPPGAAIAVLTGGVFALSRRSRLVSAPARRLVPVAAAALVLLAGCGSSSQYGESGFPSSRRRRRSATGRAIVGGADANVHQILQPNTDPHEYEPRPSDVEATAGAKLVLENGDGLDEWMGKVISQAGGKPVVVDLGAGVPVKRPGETSGPEASRFDPHWWHDPRNAEAAVGEIRDALVAADPAHATAYRRNAAAYVAELRALDADCRGVLRAGARRAAQARHRPRRVRLLRRALRHHGRRRRDPVADDAGAALRRRGGKADRADPARAREGDLPRELDQPEARAADRARDRARARATRSTATRSARPADAPTSRWMQANANAMVRGFTGGRLGCRFP